jgi:hypothetical protein
MHLHLPTWSEIDVIKEEQNEQKRAKRRQEFVAR